MRRSTLIHVAGALAVGAALFAAGVVAVMVALDTLVVASGLAGLLGTKPDPIHALLGSVATALVFHALDFALPVAALTAFFGIGRTAPPEAVTDAETPVAA